jgi:hypothetical protein
MKQACPAGCGFSGVNLGQHFRWSPYCEAASKPSASRKRERQAKRDRTASVSLFQNRIAGEIGKFFLHAHIDHYMSLTQLDTLRGLLRVCASLTTEFIEAELQLDGCPADKSIFETARRAFDILPNMNTLIDQRRRLYARAIPRHLSAIESGADRRGAAFFNAYEVSSPPPPPPPPPPLTQTLNLVPDAVVCGDQR